MLGRISRFLLFLRCLPAIGQNQLAPDSFEAAVAKTNKSREIRMAVDFEPGGRFSATNVPLRILIALAHHVRPEAVTGGPGWLGTDRFDIVEKAAQTTPPDGIRCMLQTLLAERFQLQFRAESFDLFNHHNMYVNGFVADAARERPAVGNALERNSCLKVKPYRLARPAPHESPPTAI